MALRAAQVGVDEQCFSAGLGKGRGGVNSCPGFPLSCDRAGYQHFLWRRTGATGALLIAIGCAVRLVHELVYVVEMVRVYSGAPSSLAQTMMWLGAFQSIGALMSEVLFIVGVALLLRRLPRRK